MTLRYNKIQTFKPLIAVAIILLASPMVLAGPYIPSAGSILQQIKPSMPVVPSSSETGLVIDSGEAGASSQNTQPCSATQSGSEQSDNAQPSSDKEQADKVNSTDKNLPPCR